MKRKPGCDVWYLGVVRGTDFEDGDELREVDGELEEVEEEFELVEEDDGEEVEHVVLLVVDCVGGGVVRFGAALQPRLALHPHLLAPAAARQAPQQPHAAVLLAREGGCGVSHFSL